MKIALCLFGQPRFYEKGFASFKGNLIDKYDVDVFFHTYSSEFSEGEAYSKAKWATPSYVEDRANTVKELNNLFYPKMYSNSPNLSFVSLDTSKDDLLYSNMPRSVDGDALLYNNTLSMFFSLKNVNLLKQRYEIKNNFKYDVVISSRFDLEINSAPEINLNTCANSVLVGNKKDTSEHRRSEHVMFFDGIFVSNSLDSDKICSTYDKLSLFSFFLKNKDMFLGVPEFREIVSDFNRFNENLAFFNESLHVMNFIYEKLHVKLVKNSGLTVTVIR